MVEIKIWLWILFGFAVFGMLVLDLGVLNRKAHIISNKEALKWSLVWIAVSLGFNLLILIFQGSERALEFLTGYLIEKALSVDNIFVFVLIFSYFHIAPLYQPRVLKWGIIGAIVMRGIFIFLGLELLHRFHWMIYVFGAFLIITGIKLAVEREEKFEPEKNPVLRLFKKFFPVTDKVAEQNFFIRKNGTRYATPLFVALLLIESSDLVFALDSIPAIFAITTDPFIVYTSNIFAILGLRALYFLLANLLNLFIYLKFGLSVILAFIGAKMLLAGVYKIPIGLSLGVVFGILLLSILASLIYQKKPALINEMEASHSNDGSFEKINLREGGSHGNTESGKTNDQAQTIYCI
jgi:tellurite resistance protein TerC